VPLLGISRRRTEDLPLQSGHIALCRLLPSSCSDPPSPAVLTPWNRAPPLGSPTSADRHPSVVTATSRISSDCRRRRRCHHRSDWAAVVETSSPSSAARSCRLDPNQVLTTQSIWIGSASAPIWLAFVSSARCVLAPLHGESAQISQVKKRKKKKRGLLVFVGLFFATILLSYLATNRQ
jgi:hypothetical protein